MRMASKLIMPLGLLFCLGQPRTVSAEDAVEQVVKAYLSDTDLASPNYYARWLEALVDVAEDHPDSPYFEAAMRHAVSLTNGAEDYARSVEIAKKAINLTHSPAGQALWYEEIGEVCRLQSFKTLDTNPEEAAQYAKQSIEAFTKFQEIVGNLPAEEQTTELKEFQLMASSMSGELYATILKDPRKSKDSYAFGAKLADSVSRETPVLGVAALGYDAEHFAAQAMTASLAAGDISAADSFLESLGTMRDAKRPASHYALEYARARFPKKGKDFRNFIEQWIGTHDKDGATAFLVFELARSYFNGNQYAKALQVFQELQENYDKEILKADKLPLETGEGGYMAEIMSSIIRIHVQDEKPLKAKQFFEDFRKLYPNDARLTVLGNLVEDAQQAKLQARHNQGKKIPDSNRWATILIPLNIIILCLLVALHRLRKARSGK